MPEQKLILSLVIPVLDGTDDSQLVKFLMMVNDELQVIIDDYESEQIPKLEIGEHCIQATTFVE